MPFDSGTGHPMLDKDRTISAMKTYQDHVERFGWLPMCHTYGCLNFSQEHLCRNCATRFDWHSITDEERPIALMMIRGGASPEALTKALKSRAVLMPLVQRINSLFGGVLKHADSFADAALLSEWTLRQ